MTKTTYLKMKGNICKACRRNVWSNIANKQKSNNFDDLTYRYDNKQSGPKKFY